MNVQPTQPNPKPIECPICEEDVSTNGGSYSFGCRHVFCYNCIQKSLDTMNTPEFRCFFRCVDSQTFSNERYSPPTTVRERLFRQFYHDSPYLTASVGAICGLLAASYWLLQGSYVNDLKLDDPSINNTQAAFVLGSGAMTALLGHHVGKHHRVRSFVASNTSRVCAAIVNIGVSIINRLGI